MSKKIHLDWDSDFFGKKIAKVYAEDIESAQLLLNQCKEDQYEWVYLILPSHTPPMPPLQGLYLVDHKTTYYRNLDPTASFSVHPAVVSYPAQPPSDELYELAFLSGSYSRFRIDPHCSQQQFEALYRIWIERSADRTIAQELFVYEDQGHAVGMITVAIRDQVGSIGLVAVHEQWAGKGVGKALLQTVFAYLQSKAVYQLTVVTQAQNRQACAFYEKNGFVIQIVEQIYHYWI